MVDLAYSSVCSRLVDFWCAMEVSQFILNVIMLSYRIPCFQLPTLFPKRNNTSAHENSDFVSQAVNNLLHLDLIEELAGKPNIINPLSVIIRSLGKQRLILDLWHVNQLIYKHVEIFPDHRKESAQSSTWRELKAVSLAVEAFTNHFFLVLRLSHTPITKNVESTILNGIRKADLHQLALLVFQICLKFRILLEVKWITRGLNARADALAN